MVCVLRFRFRFRPLMVNPFPVSQRFVTLHNTASLDQQRQPYLAAEDLRKRPRRRRGRRITVSTVIRSPCTHVRQLEGCVIGVYESGPNLPALVLLHRHDIGVRAEVRRL